MSNASVFQILPTDTGRGIFELTVITLKKDKPRLFAIWQMAFEARPLFLLMSFLHPLSRLSVKKNDRLRNLDFSLCFVFVKFNGLSPFFKSKENKRSGNLNICLFALCAFLIIPLLDLQIEPMFHSAETTVPPKLTYLSIKTLATSTLPQVVASCSGVEYRGKSIWLTSSPRFSLKSTSSMLPAMAASFKFLDILTDRPFFLIRVFLAHPEECGRKFQECLGGVKIFKQQVLNYAELQKLYMLSLCWPSPDCFLRVRFVFRSV